MRKQNVVVACLVAGIAFTVGCGEVDGGPESDAEELALAEEHQLQAELDEAGALDHRADEVAQGDARACTTVHVGYTYWTGGTVAGSGSTPDCPSVVVELQRQRWWGWQMVASNSGRNVSVYYNPAGTGRYAYRTLVWTPANNSLVKTSNVIVIDR